MLYTLIICIHDSKMVRVEVGKEYIISLKNIDTSKKPPSLLEWRVKVIYVSNINPDIIHVKYLSGTPHDIGKQKYISLTKFNIQIIEEQQTIEEKLEFIKGEFEKINKMKNEINKNTEEYDTFFKELNKKIEYYKSLEVEVMFLRGAILVIIYMYIMGKISFV
jgi:hypothetical protein